MKNDVLTLIPNSLAHSLIVALFTNKVIYLNHLSIGNFVLEIIDDVLSSNTLPHFLYLNLCLSYLFPYFALGFII